MADIVFKDESYKIIGACMRVHAELVADFLCYENIIVELKVAHFISKDNYKQLFNYLSATKKRLGILVNFGTPSLSYKRILNSSAPSQNSL